MPRSTNFAFLEGHAPEFDRLGHDLERFYIEAPDLSIFRARQMAELAIHLMEVRHNISRRRQLIDRIHDLSALLPNSVVTALHTVRKLGNAAVHDSPRGPVAPRAYQAKARRALTEIFRVLKWLAGELSEGETWDRPLVVPIGTGAPSYAARVADVQAQLDQVEVLVDVRSRLDEGQTLLEAVNRDLDGTLRGVPRLEADALHLRVASLARAVSNHRGRAVPRKRDEAVDRWIANLVASAEPIYVDDVALYLVRTAAGHLNTLDFERALEALAPMLAWRRGRGAEPQRATHEMVGRALGTAGQALAFRAHATGDFSTLREAIEAFLAARECFSDAEDIDRQDTYRAHALIDQLRLFPTEPPGGAELSWLRNLVGSAGVDAKVMISDPLLNEHPQGHAFRVALALKYALVTGARPTWLVKLRTALAKALSRNENAKPSHPYGILVGNLVLSRIDAPRPLQTFLMEATESPDLLGHIARTFRLEQLRRSAAGHLPPAHTDAYRKRLPDELRSWWAQHGRRRLELADPGASALDLLPFNYV